MKDIYHSLDTLPFSHFPAHFPITMYLHSNKNVINTATPFPGQHQALIVIYYCMHVLVLVCVLSQSGKDRPQFIMNSGHNCSN